MFGDKEGFAAEVGEHFQGHPDLRSVDLWACGRLLTCDDNTVFVPQFCASVRRTIDWLHSGCDLSPPYAGVSPAESHRRLLARDDAGREQFWFPRWGPTTDNVVGHVFRKADRLIVTFEFWREAHPEPEERGMVFVVEIPEVEFVRVLEETLAELGCSG